jgi:FkbM family methyltransferase
MFATTLIQVYRIWHGVLKIKGAGFLLSRAAPFVRSLQEYPLQLTDKHTVIVDFRDISAMYWLNHLLGDSFEEQGLLEAMKPFIGPDAVVWDIGANSGLLSHKLLGCCAVGEMHLFEPNPRMSTLAAQAVLPYKQATVHRFGISDRDAEFTLTVPIGHTTMGTLEPSATERDGDKCSVTCRVGDDLVFNNGFRPPQVIKIDTEGHELSVISGLSRTIAEYRPVIFFEHISMSLDKARTLFPADYLHFFVSDPTGQLVPKENGETGHNSVFVPSEKKISSRGY